MNLLPEDNLLFTYGTLKRGFPNHSIIKEIKASYIADARTIFKYPLIQSGKWNSPYMIDTVNYHHSHRINGELFSIDSYGILALDKFEGVDKHHYKRSKVEISYNSDIEQEATSEAWCYFHYENSMELLEDTSKFLPFFGKEELKEYIAVQLR